MNFSPKLKKARQDIEEIFKKYDIAGVCLLHHGQHSENFNYLTPT